MSEVRRDSQSERIFVYLKAGNKLTPIDALRLFGCFRLGARIWELIEAGHDIKSELIEVNGKRVAQYWIERKDVQLNVPTTEAH